MIKQVLVAVDGSENSLRALDFALDLTEKYTASITILNVSESMTLGTIPPDPGAITAENLVTYNKDFNKIHENILKKAVLHAKQAKPNITISSKLREGNAASQIIAEAKESNSDIIVVGHKGVGKVKELLGMGGISEKVAHTAPCPVIIVK